MASFGDKSLLFVLLKCLVLTYVETFWLIIYGNQKYHIFIIVIRSSSKDKQLQRIILWILKQAASSFQPNRQFKINFFPRIHLLVILLYNLTSRTLKIVLNTTCDIDIFPNCKCHCRMSCLQQLTNILSFLRLHRISFAMMHECIIILAVVPAAKGIYIVILANHWKWIPFLLHALQLVAYILPWVEQEHFFANFWEIRGDSTTKYVLILPDFYSTLIGV